MQAETPSVSCFKKTGLLTASQSLNVQQNQHNDDSFGAEKTEVVASEVIRRVGSFKVTENKIIKKTSFQNIVNTNNSVRSYGLKCVVIKEP